MLFRSLKYAEVGRRFSQEQSLIGTRTDAAIRQSVADAFLKLATTPSAPSAGTATPISTPVGPVTPTPAVEIPKTPSSWKDYLKPKGTR